MGTTTNQKSMGGIRRFLGEGEDVEPGPESPLGEICTWRGFITEAQLEECLEEQKRLAPHVLLGELFLRKKYLTNEQLLRALAFQKKPRAEAPTRPQIGKYRLLREVARGGMGVVHEAEDTTLRRRVALKILREDQDDPGGVERLKREAAIAAQLRHPGIITVHEVGSEDIPPGPPIHYIVMEYVEGITFASLLAAEGTEKAELLRILEEVARAAAYAHSKGVVHRDLKPKNVLVEKAGRVALGDFGIARADKFQTPLTQSNMVLGTPEYMAPEQVEGRAADIGPRTDVWALGVILYEVLSGRTPFEASSPIQVFQRILVDFPPSPGGDADLEALCMKALDKKPEGRPASATEFADVLRRARRRNPYALPVVRPAPKPGLAARAISRIRGLLGK
jgi:eukaryotic-like serine/threonine-protein kinase